MSANKDLREPSAATARAHPRRAYDPHVVEPKWQRVWEETGLYRVDLDRAERPFYNLMEFPYPSGEGLHVGHVYTYGGADAYGRYQRMHGWDVFQPMGFDAFGIHGENYALSLGINPAIVIPRNVERFREEQMKRTGVAFDWEREVDTSNPRYYRWTQWLFLQLYHGGLAYRARARVNWCPSCLTTLADEQVIGGACERCGTTVTQRELTQWFFRITRYAERLLDFSEARFPETTQKLQRAWIGRQVGAEIDFEAEGGPHITVFTTRADTLYGATFLVVAPEHPDLLAVTAPDRLAAVQAYRQQVQARSEVQRQAASQDKTGVFTGGHAINPVDGRRLPVYTADYVLAGYGTGAIFGTPAHDARDHAFALAHDLPVIAVVAPPEGPLPSDVPYEAEGVLINSGPYDGLSTEEARDAIAADVAAKGLARRRIIYRLRDWLISRQRYWGPPIPIVYCDVCGTVPVPEGDLPVLLPPTEHFRPLGTGQSPLASLPDFVNTACPHCGGAARRETDVSDNFLDSAWYYLHYTATEFDDRPWDPERLHRWLPVSQYAGGVEHSTLHHLYARFVWKALQDLGHIPEELGSEPFARLRLHGIILKDGRRMSKSRGNVINPDAYIDRYGADVLRTYLLFMGPFERGGDFSDSGINGVVRFFDQVWRLAAARRRTVPAGRVDSAPLRRAVHQSIHKVTEDIEALAFNTAIAELMGLSNAMREWRSQADEAAWEEAVGALIRMLAPLAPHLAEELWARRGRAYSVHTQPWPEYDPAVAAERHVEIAVEVDGKVRGRFTAPAGIDEQRARELALRDEGVHQRLRGRVVRRVVYVPDRLINLVTG